MNDTNRNFNALFQQQLINSQRPMIKFQQILLEGIENLTHAHLDNLQQYTSIGIEQINQLTQLRNQQDIYDYSLKQADCIARMNHLLIKDIQQVKDLNLQLKSAIQDEMKHQMSNTRPDP